MKNIENIWQQTETWSCRYTFQLGLQNSVATSRIQHRLESEVMRRMRRLLSFFLPVIPMVCDVSGCPQLVLLSLTAIYVAISMLSCPRHKPSQLSTAWAAWLHPVPGRFSGILVLKCAHPNADMCQSKWEPTGSNSPNWPCRRTERLTV